MSASGGRSLGSQDGSSGEEYPTQDSYFDVNPPVPRSARSAGDFLRSAGADATVEESSSDEYFAPSQQQRSFGGSLRDFRSGNNAKNDSAPQATPLLEGTLDADGSFRRLADRLREEGNGGGEAPHGSDSGSDSNSQEKRRSPGKKSGKKRRKGSNRGSVHGDVDGDYDDDDSHSGSGSGDDDGSGSGSDDSGDESDEEDPNLSCCYVQTPGAKELRRLCDLAGPLLINYMSINAMTLTDQSVVGHLNVDDFAAINLANAIMFGSLVLSTGILNALCTLAAQAFGAKRHGMVGLWLQVSVVWTTLILVVPTTIIWWFTGDIVRLISPDENEAVYTAATVFAQWSCLWLLPNTVFSALAVWLEALEIVVPQTIISIIFIFVNVALNVLLVFGFVPLGAKDGWAGMGLVGSPLATTISKFLQLFALLAYAARVPLVRRCWPGWTTACLKMRLVIEFFKLGIPIMMTEVLYDWVFELLTFRAAAKVSGNATLIAATGLLVNLLFFMTPFLLSIYIAVSVRVGNQLGDEDPMGAKRSTRIAFVMAVISAIVVSGLFFLLRDFVALLYTSDAGVIESTADYVPLVALDFFVSALSYVLQGVLEGSGKPALATGAAIVGNWVVGITLLFVLSEYMADPLAGLWWGVIAGEVVKMVILLIMVLRSNWEKLAEEAVERSKLEEEEDEESVARVAALLSESSPLLVNAGESGESDDYSD
jgi:MATE family, multidrug and toxin extrusion protein